VKAPDIIPVVVEHPGITSQEFAIRTGHDMKHASQDLYRCRRAGFLRRRKGISGGVGRPPNNYFVTEKGEDFLYWYDYPCMLPSIQDPHHLLGEGLEDALYGICSSMTHQDPPELRAVFNDLILEEVKPPFHITL
jgi:hypothetical protein